MSVNVNYGELKSFLKKELGVAKTLFGFLVHYNENYGVSRNFWRMCTCVWLATIACNTALSLTLLAILTVVGNEKDALEAMPRFDVVSFPLLALSILCVLGFGFLFFKKRAATNQSDLNTYLVEHEDTPVYRAVFKKTLKKPVLDPAFGAVFAFCAAFLSMPIVMFYGDIMNARAFMYAIFIMPIFFPVMLLFFVGLFGVVIPSILMSIRDIVISSGFKMNRSCVGQKFNALPQTYRDTFTRKAASLGVDPDSLDMQKAAVEDYEKTVLKAIGEAKAMSARTPAASGKASTRRI